MPNQLSSTNQDKSGAMPWPSLFAPGQNDGQRFDIAVRRIVGKRLT